MFVIQNLISMEKFNRMTTSCDKMIIVWICGGDFMYNEIDERTYRKS